MDKLNLIDFDRYVITEDGKIFSKYCDFSEFNSFYTLKIEKVVSQNDSTCYYE